MTPVRKWQIVRTGMTVIYLMAGWLLFTWSFNIRSVLLGLGFSVIIAMRTYGLFFDESEPHRRYMLPGLHLLLFYLLYLVVKMYVASFKVLILLFNRRINPKVVHFRTHLKSDIARVALSNSITMTPGTVTLQLNDDHLVVHWLDAETTHSRYAGELISGLFEKILKRIWI